MYLNMGLPFGLTSALSKGHSIFQTNPFVGLVAREQHYKKPGSSILSPLQIYVLDPLPQKTSIPKRSMHGIFPRHMGMKIRLLELGKV